MSSLAADIDNRYDREKKTASGLAPSTSVFDGSVQSNLSKINTGGISIALNSYNFNCHYAPLFGAICSVLKLSEGLTIKMFLRCMVRDVFSSSARLNIMGPLEGAKKQREFSTVLMNLIELTVNSHQKSFPSEEVADSFFDFTTKSDVISDDVTKTRNKRKKIEPVTTSPILEILQARHDVLYVRLFNS